jgi:hypothetical protein
MIQVLGSHLQLDEYQVQKHKQTLTFNEKNMMPDSDF